MIQQAFALPGHLTVGGLRDWLLSDAADEQLYAHWRQG